MALMSNNCKDVWQNAKWNDLEVFSSVAYRIFADKAILKNAASIQFAL